MKRNRLNNGWAMPGRSTKYHYFVDGISLCGKWMYVGQTEQDSASGRRSDDCHGCWAKRQRRKRNERPCAQQKSL